jgi:hypothetical protein
MKRVLNFAIMFFVFVFMTEAQDAVVSVNGVVSDEATGNPVQNYEVQVMIGDSLGGGGFYQLFTNEQGYYSIDSVLTGGFGFVQAIVLDCNYQPQVQEGVIVPGNNIFTFDFSICTDSIPQGDCMNWFSYSAGANNTMTFYGESFPMPADEYLWDFGDGTTGEGQQVDHQFDPSLGDMFVVTLTTTSYDSIGEPCTATSSQEVWVFNGGGGDCENWFQYTTEDNITFSFYGESFPNPADVYMWDFGDGETGSGQETEHTFDTSLGDIFYVTLTTVSYDPATGDSCSAMSMQEVWVGGNPGGGDCMNWFWYETEDNVSFTFFGESYPVAADEYLWDFGDGETGNGQEIEHTFDTSLGDVFYVTLTTVSYDPATGDSCSAISMQEVWAGGNPWGDCDNFFWYELTGDFTYSFMGEAFPVPADYYSWDFGDGTTAEGQEVEHTFDPSLGNTFTVCLTTYSYDPVTDSCTATSCQDIELSGQMGQQIMGTIYTNGTPADYALVGLFGMDNGGAFVYDFVMTDPQTGTYFFDNVPEGEYYLMASLTPQSPEFVNYFPTYYGDVLYWFDATVITLGTPANPYDINLIEIGNYSAGPGNIGGTITIGEGKGSPGNNISVVLMDENENALTYTVSNEEGLFDFSNLGYGTYKLKVEMPGKSSEIATIVIDDENQQADLDFIVKSSSVVLSAEEGFERFGFAGEVYPNPVSNEANLELTLTEALNATVTVYSQTGQIVYTKKHSLKAGRQLLKLNLSGLSDGIYLLKINEGSNQLTKRFIKR